MASDSIRQRWEAAQAEKARQQAERAAKHEQQIQEMTKRRIADRRRRGLS